MKLLKIIFLILCSVKAYGSEKDFFMIHPLDNMPILERISPNKYGANAPIEQRDEIYNKFLAASVQIKVLDGYGSGSIIYYDEKNNIAYVASCGHLWNKGVLLAKDAKTKDLNCKIIIWYKNEKKLEKKEEFDAKLVFYSYTDDIDTSLITFKPDWAPKYFPIAPLNYEYKINSHAHSCGCDEAKEVAHYDVKILEINDDLITIKNSPRPGRSGGGLFDEKFYIGTCWGTEYVDGSGIGFFTPIRDIHSFWGKQKGYEFLLKVRTKGIFIPIINRNRPQENYSQDYILAP